MVTKKPDEHDAPKIIYGTMFILIFYLSKCKCSGQSRDHITRHVFNPSGAAGLPGPAAVRRATIWSRQLRPQVENVSTLRRGAIRRGPGDDRP